MYRQIFRPSGLIQFRNSYVLTNIWIEISQLYLSLIEGILKPMDHIDDFIKAWYFPIEHFLPHVSIIRPPVLQLGIGRNQTQFPRHLGCVVHPSVTEKYFAMFGNAEKLFTICCGFIGNPSLDQPVKIIIVTGHILFAAFPVRRTKCFFMQKPPCRPICEICPRSKWGHGEYLSSVGPWHLCQGDDRVG